MEGPLSSHTIQLHPVCISGAASAEANLSRVGAFQSTPENLTETSEFQNSQYSSFNSLALEP